METKSQDESNQEIELKLQLLKDVKAEAIWQLPYVKRGLIDSPEQTFLYSVYYDSIDQRLLKQGYSLRVRKNKGDYTLTVKKMGHVTAGLHQRTEWNYSLSSEVPSVEAIEDKELLALLELALEGQRLEPLMVTDFTRTQSNWQDEKGNLVELAIDEGHIETDKQRHVIREVELELKRGKATILLRLGEALASAFSMNPANESKFYRGLQMLGLVNQGVSFDENLKKTQININQHDMRNVVHVLLEEAFRQVLARYQHLSKNGITDEGVHQIRVSCRHVRSLLHFFKPILSETSWKPLNEDLRSLANRFAKLREIQVMKYHYQQSTCTETCSQFEEIIGEQYDKELKYTEKIMKSGEMTPALLRSWRRVMSLQLKKKYENKRITDFAEGRLTSWVEKYNQVYSKITTDDMQHLHQARIRAKRIRYAVEWLQPILPKKLVKTVRPLKEHQELMGQLHDIHCERVKLRGWIVQSGSTAERMYQLGFYEGWQEKHKYQLWERLIKG